MTESEVMPIRAALDAGDFARAQELLARLSVPPSTELLELQAQAAYGAGDLEGTLAAYDELYRRHLDNERTHEAAHAAVMVGKYLMKDTGLMATVRPWMRREFGWPLTELGNARLRKGNFAGAEEAFLAAHQNAWLPQPGFALLRLAQGRVDEAYSMIADALNHPFDIPWKERPPSGELQRAPLRDAQVVIALAAGEDSTARTAAVDLEDIAQMYQSRKLQNSALAAKGRLALHDGHESEAIRLLGKAVMEWVSLRMPFEAATLRIELAAAHRVAGNYHTAKLELAAADRALEDLNTVP